MVTMLRAINARSIIMSISLDNGEGVRYPSCMGEVSLPLPLLKEFLDDIENRLDEVQDCGDHDQLCERGVVVAAFLFPRHRPSSFLLVFSGFPLLTFSLYRKS